MTTQFDADGVPLPDPELTKKWREAALRDLPTPQEFADLIAAMRWGAELDRIGAANKELPDRVTSIEYMLRMLTTFFSASRVLEGNGIAPLIRLHAAIVDLANGRQSELLVPVIKKPGHPGKGVTHALTQALAARALSELVDSGEPLDQAANRVAQALRKGRKDMHDVTGTKVKNWRARLQEGPGARGVSDDALKHYLAPLPANFGSTSKMRGENLLKVFRERGEAFG